MCYLEFKIHVCMIIDCDINDKSDLSRRKLRLRRGSLALSLDEEATPTKEGTQL